MNKPSKLFLTSGFCMVMIAPAIADIASDNSNPTCDATTIGASSGNTSLDAVWNLVNQTCESGKYFDMTSATCVTCTSNNYCPGGTYSVESQDNGLNSCPNDYSLSAQGSSAQTDCYRTCTTNDVAHSTAVSGGYYYGNNNQCSATSCAAGWHVQSLQLPDEYTNSGTNTYASYTNSGFYVPSYSPSDAATFQALYGLNQQNTWAASLNDYGFGTLYGESACSTIPGDNKDWSWSNPTKFDNLTDETGQSEARYCYCRITGYTQPLDTTKQPISTSWVFRHDHGAAYGSESACAEHCATSCADGVATIYQNGFRDALMASTNNTTSSCLLTIKSCVAGEYFDETAIMCKTCDANHYCPGGVYSVESESYGKNNCPSGYGLSATGTSSIDNCYRNCTNSDVAHATGVNGAYYYGDNNQCAATSCAAGWHLKEGFNISTATITNSAAGWINNDGLYNSWSGLNQSDIGLTSSNTWGVVFTGFGKAKGTAFCSSTTGAESTLGTPNISETGAQCWCKMTEFVSTDNVSHTVNTEYWLADHNYSSQGGTASCVDGCASSCANTIRCTGGSCDAQLAIFSIIRLSSCEANTINIDWYNMDTIHEQNQCTYSESITLPETNPERTGYNFTGWSVRPASTPATTE